jgi:hypothetical protein
VLIPFAVHIIVRSLLGNVPVVRNRPPCRRLRQNYLVGYASMGRREQRSRSLDRAAHGSEDHTGARGTILGMRKARQQMVSMPQICITSSHNEQHPTAISGF